MMLFLRTFLFIYIYIGTAVVSWAEVINLFRIQNLPKITGLANIEDIQEENNIENFFYDSGYEKKSKVISPIFFKNQANKRGKIAVANSNFYKDRALNNRHISKLINLFPDFIDNDEYSRGRYVKIPFSTDYIDFDTLRNNKKQNDFRKSNHKHKYADSGSSNELKKHKTPKRFTVIDNSDRSWSEEKENKLTDSSSEENGGSFGSWSDSRDISDSSAEEIKITKKNKKSKKKNKNKKYLILQGNRYISDTSGEDSRRNNRLPYFLPKRFNWNIKDIHRLGYFWFNGPQGRFSFFPMRS